MYDETASESSKENSDPLEERGIPELTEYGTIKGKTVDALKNLQDSMESMMPLETAAGLILEMAHLPDAKEFIYSQKLQDFLKTAAESLQKTYHSLYKADQRNDIAKYKKHLAFLFEKAKDYAQGLMQCFLKDNLPNADYLRFKKGRIESLRVTLDLKHAKAHLEILKELARDDIRTARQRTRTYVVENLLHLDPGQSLDPHTAKLVKEMTNIHFRTMQDSVFPAFEKGILSYAQKGSVQSFKDAAVQAKDLFVDWVRVPFNDDARDRMAYFLTPSAQIGVKGHAELFPIIGEIAQTAYHVSINHEQFLALLDTILGRISFDALIMAATWGAGSAIKGGQITGAAGQGLRLLTLSLSTTRSAMAPPIRTGYHLTNMLTLDSLKEKLERAKDGASARFHDAGSAIVDNIQKKILKKETDDPKE